MFDSVLIANRGEIAVRIIRTLEAMAIRSVAIFSDEDRGARHVAAADAAIRIGPPPPTESYLNVDAIIDAATRSGADAIHPGYGFLSENAAFVRACEQAGIVFIGPPSHAIEAMGDKIRAKATVALNGVRVVPGIDGTDMSDDALAAAAAQEVGFPLLIKPSAGGGGKGMRLVDDETHLLREVAAARREAIAAFGDETLLVERFVDRARHIEVQILADAYGNILHLGERECSLQRRHQKIIEEAPSILLDDAARASIGEQAIAAASACGYVNAGTVEFIVSGDAPDEQYFMEMNTRLQVEHPVTEAVWGLDLVEWQLRIAAGERLAFQQGDLAPSGHAVEARVYAEDPCRGFLPTGGTVVGLREPSSLASVRVDSSLTVGQRVGSVYDPMLSKVIAWASDRETALRRLDRALSGTSILGVGTNVGFLRRLLVHPRVVQGDLDTGLVDRIATGAQPGHAPPEAVIVAALHVQRSLPNDPWRQGDGWRAGAAGRWTWRSREEDGGAVSIDFEDSRAGLVANVAGQHLVIGAVTHQADGAIQVEIDHELVDAHVARSGSDVWVGVHGDTWRFSAPTARPTGQRTAHGAQVRSPMPGRVVAVFVQEGDKVEPGQPIVSVEAMKMEHNIAALSAGVVERILVSADDLVDLNEELVRIAPVAETAD